MRCDHCQEEIPIKRKEEYFEITRRVSEGGKRDWESYQAEKKDSVFWGSAGTLVYHNHCFSELAGEEFRQELIEKSFHRYDKPVPENPIDLVMTSTPVLAKIRKLKKKWEIDYKTLSDVSQLLGVPIWTATQKKEDEL